MKLKRAFIEHAEHTEELIKIYAEFCGHPGRDWHELTAFNRELLSHIPGTFGAEDTPEGCPVEDPVRRAYFDLLPRLSVHHAYKDLVFGFGRQWYGIGNTPQEARAALRGAHHYQMGCYYGQILPNNMRREEFLEYHAWKNATAGRNDQPPENNSV